MFGSLFSFSDIKLTLVLAVVIFGFFVLWKNITRTMRDIEMLKVGLESCRDNMNDKMCSMNHNPMYIFEKSPETSDSVHTDHGVYVCEDNAPEPEVEAEIEADVEPEVEPETTEVEPEVEAKEPPKPAKKKSSRKKTTSPASEEEKISSTE